MTKFLNKALVEEQNNVENFTAEFYKIAMYVETRECIFLVFHCCRWYSLF